LFFKIVINLFRMRKKFTWFILLFILAACQEKKPNAPVVVNGKGDSATRMRTDNKQNPYSAVDVSPMDMAYFPVEYPKLKMSHVTNDAPLARVVYSRPHLQGRVLFKDVLKYGEKWRLGANEATEIELFKDAAIQGKQIKAGRYILYCIPNPENWIIVFNTNIDTWGIEQDSTQDLARFPVPVTKTQRNVEYFTIVFEKSDKGADLLMVWGDIEARLPIEF
jgi:hypothetical protein